MKPIGVLMREHRVIERVIKALDIKQGLFSEGRRADPFFIDKAVNFMTVYTDLMHHAKEETIFSGGSPGNPWPANWP